MGIANWITARLWAGLLALAAGVGLGLTPNAAVAQSPTQFDIPAGRLSSSIRALARQANITVASRESGIRRVQAKPVRGALSPAQALRRLLAGTDYRAVPIDGGFRIERRPAQPRRASTAPRQPVVPVEPPAPIIVEGAKRAFSALDYPGGVSVIAIDDPSAFAAGESLDAALEDAPAVNGTALGSGRNKVFLRGIADSSFNGPTPSTIGLYLGEQRLIFSAPNPDLRLYDTDTVEVLEGPQGTLYGAGTIAGLVRVNPRTPDASGVEGQGWASGGFTRDGGFNWDLAAMANLPVASSAALRVVGYGGEESGFIDDPRRRLRDINTSSHFGGRAGLAFDLEPDWEVILTGFGQHNEARDGQYTDGDLRDLQREAQLGQPFRGRIYGGSFTVRGALGALELTSTTGLVDHALRTAFDSSILVNTLPPRNGGTGSGGMEGPMGSGGMGSGGMGPGGMGPGGMGSGGMGPGGMGRPPGPRQTFQETREIRLISHETRVSGGDPDGLSGLIGVSALRNRDRLQQLVVNFNTDTAPPPFANLTYRLDEIALFGEGSFALSPQWRVTGGARLLYTSASSERLFAQDTLFEPRDGPLRLLPALALSWQPNQDWMVYARAQEGFRTGGVTIERDPDNTPQEALFDPDTVRSVEAGVRGQWNGAVPIDVTLTVHHSDWDNIQADVLDRNGFPLTRNIGDGRVTGADASVHVRAGDGWDFTLRGAVNDTSIGRLLPDGGVVSVELPNVPDVSGLARVAKRWSMGSASEAGAALTGRYVGRSFLDLDQVERVKQGDFGALDAALWWEGRRWGLRLEALNLTNTRGNRFAFGNPFTARTENQVTPLRPLTVRLQVTLRR